MSIIIVIIGCLLSVFGFSNYLGFKLDGNMKSGCFQFVGLFLGPILILSGIGVAFSESIFCGIISILIPIAFIVGIIYITQQK